MHIPQKLFHYLNMIGTGLALLLCTGCATAVKVDRDVTTFANSIAYEPVRAPVQIDASAAVEAVYTPSSKVKASWKLSNGFNDTEVANYIIAIEQTLRNDPVKSGLFSRIVTNDATKADYLVRVALVREMDRGRVTLTAIERATGTEIFKQDSDYSDWGQIAGILAALKSDLVTNLQAKAARQDAVLFAKASLSDLLAGVDKTEPSARERNRALIAAKNQQLPAMLRDWKTDALAALVVKIEQTILDLNHESEVAKDRAQQATATNGDARQINELRGLTISYRERIELLKPILNALKEEIANRGR